MDPSNRPQTISAQEFGLRHMQALQRLRDETLLVLNALDKAPRAELDESFRALPRLVKDTAPDFAAAHSQAKLSLAINTLRRALQMNSLFLERIFQDKKTDSNHELAGTERSPNDTNILQTFRDKLRQAEASEMPAATLASLAALERILREKSSGTDPEHTRPPVVELILVEVDANGAGADSGSLKVKPWQQRLETGDWPEVNTRLIESVLTTSIVAAHEALQAGERLHSQKYS